MAALRCAMSKLAGGRALQRLRASPAASFSPARFMSATGASLAPKHPCAAGATSDVDHATLVKQLQQKKDELYRVLAQTEVDKSCRARLNAITRIRNKYLLHLLSVQICRPGDLQWRWNQLKCMIWFFMKNGLPLVCALCLSNGRRTRTPEVEELTVAGNGGPMTDMDH